jgi:hypothetical protein
VDVQTGPNGCSRSIRWANDCSQYVHPITIWRSVLTTAVSTSIPSPFGDPYVHSPFYYETTRYCIYPLSKPHLSTTTPHKPTNDTASCTPHPSSTSQEAFFPESIIANLQSLDTLVGHNNIYNTPANLTYPLSTHNTTTPTQPNPTNDTATCTPHPSSTSQEAVFPESIIANLQSLDTLVARTQQYWHYSSQYVHHLTIWRSVRI